MSKHLLLATATFAALLFAIPVSAQDSYGVVPHTGVAVGYETRLSALEDQLRALTGKTEQ